MTDNNSDPTDEQETLDTERRKTLLACTDLLESIRADRSLLACLNQQELSRLLEAAGRVSNPNRIERRKLFRECRRREIERARRRDRELLAQTGMRQQAERQVFPTPAPDPSLLPNTSDSTATPPPTTDVPAKPTAASTTPGGSRATVATVAEELTNRRNCYTCKTDYRRVHHFYDALCPDCAELNFAKRNQTHDLTGRTALVTGARVKIGYQTAIKLLRAGARVIATTRFPRDAAARYSREPDFTAWRDHLVIHGLDLRHTPSVSALTEHVLESESRLDFLLNNACQTVRRPPDFYRHLMESERTTHAELPEPARLLLRGHDELTNRTAGSVVRAAQGSVRQLAGLQHAAELSQVPLTDDDWNTHSSMFPEGRLDADLQQIDMRKINSWRLKLDEVPVVELLEVHLVNAVAPFVLNSRLKPLMLKVPTRDKHIVNVSAMEGQFYRSFKTDKHPHTNMAKAALNMMTRTSAPDYLEDGIHMNSVDTGWITDEDPVAHAERKREEHGFHPPLDHVDAAARICDPIFSGFLTGEHVWGQFLKDYRPVRW